MVHNQTLLVLGDVSMESNVDVSATLTVGGAVVHNQILLVLGDVSMESSLEVSNNLLVRTDLFVDGDVSSGLRWSLASWGGRFYGFSS